MTRQQYAEMLEWIENRPAFDETLLRQESRVPYWIWQLDAALGVRGDMPIEDRPCALAASKTCKDFRAAGGRYSGRCSPRTAAVVWQAAVDEFKRVAEQVLN